VQTAPNHELTPSACLDENALSALFERAGTPEQSSKLDKSLEHTANCSACRKLIAHLALAQSTPHEVPNAGSSASRQPHTIAQFIGRESTAGAAAVALRARSPQATQVVAGTPHAVQSGTLWLPPIATPEHANADSPEFAARDNAATEAADAPFADPRIGLVLRNKWRLESLLGAGGMGKVYAATHRNGRRFAIKLMRDELVRVPDLVERFVQEGYVANQLAHPGAVSIVDDDKTDDGVPFLVMDLLVGESMRDRIKRDGAVPLAQALEWLDQVLAVLELAHAKGIVHRDIKPDNLFVESSGVVRVLDFGLARVRDGMSAAHRTRSGVPVGTIGFMPPEQALGQVDRMNARSDVWAAGATLFTVLSGTKVHDVADQVDGMFMAMTASVERIAERLPTTPTSIVHILQRALAFSQEARFADAGELRRALQQARTPAVSPSIGNKLANGTVVLTPTSTTAAPSAAHAVVMPPRAPQRTFLSVFVAGHAEHARSNAQQPQATSGLRLPPQAIWIIAGFVLCLALIGLFAVGSWLLRG
jgi:serine/threonine protein kinase